MLRGWRVLFCRDWKGTQNARSGRGFGPLSDVYCTRVSPYLLMSCSNSTNQTRFHANREKLMSSSIASTSKHTFSGTVQDSSPKSLPFRMATINVVSVISHRKIFYVFDNHVKLTIDAAGRFGILKPTGRTKSVR